MNLKDTPPYLKAWATTFNLVAIPLAGNQLNAYYDRSSLRFFWGKDPNTQVVVYTCDAVGIVAHEIGHAILDAMRPDLWNTAILEFFAFHEAFGDILAIASVLQHDVVIERLLAETTTPPDKIPDLWQSTVVSRLARQLGHAVYYTSKMSIGTEKYLRNSFNDFKYVDPLTLTLGVSEDVLTQNPHNFSRIFSGAWYECFCELFKSDYTVQKQNPQQAIIAVKDARDTMIRALLDATLIVPSRLQFLQSVAMTMIEVLKKQNKLREVDVITKVFKRRNLWIDDLNDIAPTTLLTSANIGPKTPNNFMKISLGATATLSSRDINVELPKLISKAKDENPQEKLTKSIMSFMNYIGEQDLLGDIADNNMFMVMEDKLIRNYICSSFKALPQIANKQLSKIGNIVK